MYKVDYSTFAQAAAKKLIRPLDQVYGKIILASWKITLAGFRTIFAG